MSSLPQQTCRLNSASIVVVLFGLLLMKFSAAAPASATTTAVDSRNFTNFSTSSTPSTSSEDSQNLVLLYEDSHFKGIRSRLHVGESTCVNLMGKLNDFFSSVDTMGGCYLLCEHLNCRGRCVKITGKIPRLSAHGLNDCVSSLRSCEESSSNNSWSFLRRKRRIRRSATKLKKSQDKIEQLLGLSSSNAAVTSPFSSKLSNLNDQQRRTRRHLQANRRLASMRTGNDDLSADNSSRIVVSSLSSPVTSSFPEQLSSSIQRRRRIAGSTDEGNGNYNSRYTDTLNRRSNHTEVERTTPHILHLQERRLLRISRYRRKRKELIVK